METRATGVQLNKITVALPLSNTQKLLNWINRKSIAGNTILAIHPPDENWIEQKQRRKSKEGNMISVIHPSEGKRKEGIVREALIDSQINANHRCVCHWW